jgi:hypothetical protein
MYGHAAAALYFFLVASTEDTATGFEGISTSNISGHIKKLRKIYQLADLFRSYIEGLR